MASAHTANWPLSQRKPPNQLHKQQPCLNKNLCKLSCNTPTKQHESTKGCHSAIQPLKESSQTGQTGTVPASSSGGRRLQSSTFNTTIRSVGKSGTPQLKERAFTWPHRPRVADLLHRKRRSSCLSRGSAASARSKSCSILV